MLRQAAIVCALLLIAASPAASLTWSAPIHVDDATPAGHTSYLSSLTCLSASWCIGPDTEGRVATSTNPTGGPFAWSTRSVTPYGMDQIACPSQSECVGVDDNGDVSSSTDPTGGPWSTASVDFGHELGAIACPSTNFCIGADDFGDVVTSTNPTGGAGSWSPPTPTGNDAFVDSLSCPSTTLCVGGGLGIIYSTSPSGGTSAWHFVNPDEQPIRGVACPSTELCVAVDDAGNVLTTTDPATGTWTVANIEKISGLRGVACPSVNLCVAADTSGNVYTTTNPAGGASTWSSPMSVDPGGNPAAISCPDTDFCAVTDAAGHVITSTNPAGGSGAWQLHIAEAGANSIVSVSCPSTRDCVALDQSGRALTSTDPTNPTSWSFAPIAGLHGEDALSLSCPSLALCVGMGRIEPTTIAGPGELLHRQNTIVTSTAPTSGGGSWSSFTPPNDSLLNATDLTCPTTKFCAALQLDAIATTTTPTSSTAAWRPSGRTDTNDQTASLACASAQLCLVTDLNGGVGVSTDPTDSPSRWATFRIDTAAPLLGDVGSNISLYDSACTDYPFCIATDDGGNVVSSVNPAGGAGAWKTVNLGLSYSLGPITCAAVTLCVALAPAGHAVYSYAPWGGATGWHADVIDPTSQLSAIACPSVGLCVAGDEDGNILIGSGPPTGPYAPPPPGHSTTGTTGVTRTAARKALAGALNHSCQREAISKIIHTARCRTPIIAPGPGHVTITWTGSRKRLIARAQNIFVKRGRRTVTVKLTPKGKTTLRRTRHTIRVRLNGTFTDAAHHRYALSRTITLRSG